jgi:hypothetical protein
MTNTPPINQDVARGVMALATGAATAYATYLGVDHAVEMKREKRRTIATGLALCTGTLVVYHLLSEKSGWKLPF